MSRRDQRRPLRSPRRIILVLCEGDTESAYFTYLRRTFGERSIKYEIISLEGSKLLSDLPNKLAQRDWEIIENAWLVLDTEGQRRQREQRLQRVLRRYQKIKVCWSDPSIERWFLLHFTESNAPFSNAQEVIQRLKNYCADYDKDVKSIGLFLSSLYHSPLCLKTCLRCAIERAQRLEAAAQAIGDPPPTQIHRLIQAIFPAVQPVAGEDCRKVCRDRRC